MARPDIYDPTSYAVSQALGETARASGGAGIVYDSVRHSGGLGVVAHRPRNISEMAQGDHFEIFVQAAARRIDVHKLSCNS